MRTIKFRIWDGEEMNYDQSDIFYHMHTGAAFNDGIKITQYTGLKDKNGKEIYEGDIVQWEKSGDTWGEKQYITKREVKFKDGAFLTHTEFSVNENYLPIIATWGEVIGNIYESPDLLNKGSE